MLAACNLTNAVVRFSQATPTGAALRSKMKLLLKIGGLELRRAGLLLVWP